MPLTPSFTCDIILCRFNALSLSLPPSPPLLHLRPASTRKLYEKKLQKLLDDGPAPPLEPKLPQLVLTNIQVNHNGKSDSDLYSDKEDGESTDYTSMT